MLKDTGMQATVNEMRLMLEAGCVYRYARRFREARDVFQGVRALAPTQEAADLALAGVSLDEGKLEEAETHCRRALELNRASATAYAQLGEIQMLKDRAADARQSLQKSLDLSPNGPSAALVKTLMKLSSMAASKS